jgi:methylated-DNA-protein-cysteine methyltransferase related protein
MQRRVSTGKRSSEGSYQVIWRVVACIPRGRVSTYAAIARMAGLQGRARMVGYAMHSLPEGSGIPWHRVINSRGGISAHPDPLFGQMQRGLLEQEGVVFGPGGLVDLERWGWLGE